MNQRTCTSGFSSAELLITLFIAAAFLMTGYQLLGAINQDSGAARQRARASNVAYEYLRRYTANPPATCTNSTPLNNSTPPEEIDGLSAVTITVTISCPQSSLPSLTRVQSTVSYGNPSQEVSHAVFVSS